MKSNGAFSKKSFKEYIRNNFLRAKHKNLNLTVNMDEKMTKNVDGYVPFITNAVNYGLSFDSTHDTYLSKMYVNTFRNYNLSKNVDVYFDKYKFFTVDDLYKIIDCIKATVCMVTGDVCSVIQGNTMSWVISEKCLIEIKKLENLITLYIHGYKHTISSIKGILSKELISNKTANINWWFWADHGPDIKSLPLKSDMKIYDSYYPFFKEGVENYFERYMKSSAPILLMVGEPGTGKTSLIRYELVKRNLNAVVTYDERVMTGDYFYIDFLTSNESDIMIVEDADTLLTSRENDGNKIISKLLNVSDGLVKVFNKKIIFTTNLSNTSQIDSALIRPGRCFDVVNFRKLTLPEAKLAASDAGIEMPATCDDEYRLTDIFNGFRSENKKLTRVGF